jgi:16S rRNA processing protein RimM
MSNYFNIGKLAATFGFKGEILLQHSLGKKTSLKGLEAIFIEDKNDSFLPYFIESTKIKDETHTYLKLQGLNTKEEAHKIIKREVWIPEADFKKFAGASAPISLLGFTMINEGKVLGEVLEVIEQPHQVLCKIMYNNKEALIPIHENSLMEVDKKKRIVYVDLPEGLLDIYA